MKKMKKKITFIGAGPGGYVAAQQAAQMGAEVTVIEKDTLGGICLNWGCIPTKTLKSSAEVFAKTGRLAEFGIRLDGQIKPDWAAIMTRKNRIVKTMVGGIENAFKAEKIKLIKGSGQIIDPHCVRVRDENGIQTMVESDRLILATGSRPQPLPALPFNGQTILSSSDALTLEEIPGELLVLGGGVIGVEFAFIFNAFGTQVTVVEGLDRLLPLPSVDADSSKTLQREMKKKRIPFYPNKTVTRTEMTPKGKMSVTLGPSPFLETISEKDKKEIDLLVDKMLVTIGRIPNTEHLGLESIGLQLDAGGWIVANSKMETNVPDVYAIGDVLGPSKMMLAHVASMEGLVAVDNCLGGNREMNYQAVPSAIYTFPEVADVGLTETQAQVAGIDYRVDKFLFRELGMAHVMGELAGQVKIVSEKKSGKIIGVHMIGAHVTELIAEATLAVQQGVTVQDLAVTIHAHPSLAEGMWETARKASFNLDIVE